MPDGDFLEKKPLETEKSSDQFVKKQEEKGILDKLETTKQKEMQNEVTAENRSPEKESAEEPSKIKEISDAILELIEEINFENKSEKLEEDFDERIISYGNLDPENELMDYSKLEYGHVADPLNIELGPSDYGSNDSSEGSFVAEETITIKELEELINEKVFSDLLKTSTTNISPEIKEKFEYYRLFNSALISMKYELAFS